MLVLLRFQGLLVNEPTHFNHGVYTLCRLWSSCRDKAFSVSRDNMAADEAYVFSVIYAMREKERKTSVVQAGQRSRFTLLACEQTPRVEGGGVCTQASSFSLVSSYDSHLACQRSISNRTNDKLSKILTN